MTDRPIYHAFNVRNYKKPDGSDDAFWTKIGAVFAHKDGKRYDVVLDCLALDGRIKIREPKEVNAARAGRSFCRSWCDLS